MPTWFNYIPLAPLLEQYTDDGTRDLCTAKISIATAGDFEVSLVGTPSAVELIRVATLNSDGNLNPVQIETVGKLMDHMFAVLRFTYNADVAAVRFGENRISLGSHDNDGKPSLAIKMRPENDESYRVPSDNIRNVFVSSMKIRHLMKLLSDTQNPEIPLQYQFLSLYKIFELEFRRGRKWHGLNELMLKYKDRYQALKLKQRSLESLMHELRDKCAHIKVGGNDDLGIVGLDGPDAKIVASAMPLLKQIVIEHISSKYTDLNFHPPEQTEAVSSNPT